MRPVRNGGRSRKRGDDQPAQGVDVPDECIYIGQTVSTGKTVSLNPADHEEEMREALQRMLCNEDRPTGILVALGQDAELVYTLMRQMGLRVPEDISLMACLGDVNPDRPFFRRLSAVTFDDMEIGRRAVELLEQMQSGERPLDDDETIIMPLGFARGETLGPAPQALESHR